MTEISVIDADRMVSDGEIFLLDVREDDEWAAFRAPGATHIPMGEVQARIADLPKDQTIACICHLGGRSAMVAEALAGAGFDAVNVVGGMNAWEQAGLAIDRS